MLINIKDENNKEFSFDDEKLFNISGDIIQDKKNGNAITTTDSIRHRVNKVRDIKFVDVNNNSIDPSVVLDEYNSGAKNISALDVDIEATHSGPNHNFCIYTEESMDKDAISFMNPFNKPMLKNHDDYSEPLGRINEAHCGPSALTDERAAIHIRTRITDKDAIPKILDGRYQTVSIGGTMGTVTCNICGKTILKDQKFNFCGHMRGEQYKGKTCYWTATDIEYNECSIVNNPADDYAQIMKVTVLTNSDDKSNDSNNNKEESDMAGNVSTADAMKKSIGELIDSILGTDNVTDSQTAAEDINETSDSAEASAEAGVEAEVTDSDNTESNEANEAEAKDAEQQSEEVNDTSDLEQQVTDLKASLEESEGKIKELEDQIETLNNEVKSVKDECDSYKEKCIALAESNKSMIVDSIIEKEVAINNLTEDKIEEKKAELMAMSTKDLSSYEVKAQDRREPASVANPTLVEDSNKDDNSNSADANTLADQAKTPEILEDFVNEIVGKLSK